MTTRRASAFLFGALLTGCAGSAMTPPMAAGAVPAAHLFVGEPDSVVALHDESVRMSHEEFGGRIAENRAELEALWSDGKLSAPLPVVDFSRRIVVAFAANCFCNCGELTGVVVTSSGEIVPEVGHTDDVCELIGLPYEISPVYVMSLPRRVTPPGKYAVRLGTRLSRSFVVSGVAPGGAPVATTAPTVPIPSPGPDRGRAHPRRGRVVSLEAPPEGFPQADSAAVWVRDDAVWFPSRSAVDTAGTENLLACDDHECLHGFVRVWCDSPECPGAGTLLITARPLRARGPWPMGESEWTLLVEEMDRDPVLSDILRRSTDPTQRGPLPTYPHPAPPRVGWTARPFSRFGFEQSLGAAVGVFVREGAGVGGADLRLGFRWADGVSEMSGWRWNIREAAVGEMWGVDVRGRLLWELDPTGETRRWGTLGAALTSDNPLGRNNGDSRVRVPSLLALVLPEVGIMLSPDAPVSVYTAHGVPVSLLIGNHFAVECRPSFTLRFASGPLPGADALVAMSLSLMHR